MVGNIRSHPIRITLQQGAKCCQRQEDTKQSTMLPMFVCWTVSDGPDLLCYYFVSSPMSLPRSNWPLAVYPAAAIAHRSSPKRNLSWDANGPVFLHKAYKDGHRNRNQRYTLNKLLCHRCKRKRRSKIMITIRQSAMAKVRTAFLCCPGQPFADFVHQKKYTSHVMHYGNEPFDFYPRK